MSDSGEDEDFSKIFQVLRALNLFEKYSQIFKENEMSDALVEYCISKNTQDLNQIIGIVGHRTKFMMKWEELSNDTKRELPEELVKESGSAAQLSECGPAEVASGGQISSPVTRLERNEKLNWVPVLPIESQSLNMTAGEYFHRGGPPPPYTHVANPEATFPSSIPPPDPEPLPEPEKQPPSDPWKGIAESLHLKGSAKFTILKKVKAKALETYQKCIDETLDLPFAYLQEVELNDLRDNAEDRAFVFLQTTLQYVDSSVLSASEKELNEELTKLAKTLHSRNEKQKHDGIKELEDAAISVAKTYTTSVKGELGEQILTKDEFDSVAMDFKGTAIEEYVTSYGNRPMFSSDLIKKKLQSATDKVWVEMQRNNKILIKRRDETVKNATKIYENVMTTCTAPSEFEDLHHSSKNRGMDAIKVSGLKDPLRRHVIEEYENRIWDLKKFVHDKLLERIAKAEEEVKKLGESSLKGYTEKMKPVITSGHPLYEETLLGKHTKAYEEVIKKAEDGFNKINNNVKQPTPRRQEMLKYVEAAVAQKYAEISEANQEKWIKFEKAATSEVETLKAIYQTEMKKLEEALNPTEFERSEHEIRAKLEERFLKGVDNKISKPEFYDKLKKNLDSSFEIEKKGVLDIFSMKQMKDEIAVNGALWEAKRYYMQEMETRVKAKPYFQEAELRVIHEKTLIAALKASDEVTELNERQHELLISNFDVVFKRFSDENKCRMPKAEQAIGIDLGTTNCCMGVYMKDKVVIIPNVDYQAEKHTVPSYVTFNDDHSIDVGHLAKEKAYRKVDQTIFDAKRLIGRKFVDEEVQRDMQHWPFKVVDRGGEPKIVARGKEFRPEEISAKILTKLKHMAEKYLGGNQKVRKAVITVPAYFSNAQRKATKDAADIAGLEAVILNEPTAAAVAFKLASTGDLKKNVLVFDLGGGTFDVVAIKIDKGSINVLATGGDTHLGGEDFDQNMVDEIVRRVKAKYGVDLAEGRDSNDLKIKLEVRGRLRRLRFLCEKEKQRLSLRQNVTIVAENIHPQLPAILEESFSREDFNNLNMKLFQKCIDSVDSTLKEAKLNKRKIDDIVLVGGSTRILKIQEMLKSYFEGRKELIQTIDPDEAVAIGAAYEAALRFADTTGRGKSSIERGIQDRTPLSLGVAVHSVLPDQMCVVIPKNTEIPCKITEGGFTTMRDFQTSCSIRIYEGEHDNVNQNVPLGRFELVGIPRAPQGQEKLECTMEIDDEGILHVEAQIVTNGKIGNIRIETYNGRMSPEEIKKAKTQELLRWT